MTVEKWLGNNRLSLDIWHKKYQDNNESFDAWLDRVSNGSEDIKKLILAKKFLFGGRILASRGVKDRKVTYSNCYVISPPDDSIESIFETGSRLARTYSYGGGCGIDISKLRPKGAIVHNAAKSTSGAVSFMDFYSYVTGLIGQSGRRGALMLSIDCSHPDVEDFINLKTQQGVCEKANISIRVTDDFMNAALSDKEWVTTYTSPQTGTISKTFKAKDLLKLLAKRNWEWAEPGLLYWDRISQYNMLDNNEFFSYSGVNPCAEEPLPAGGSCLLGSINLSEFVKDAFTPLAAVSYENLSDAVAIAVRGLNEVLNEGIELHPLKEQRESVRNWRQIGLGTMGMADMLIKLGLVYGSEESLALLHDVYRCIAVSAIKTSIELAKIYGPYPMCNKELVSKSGFIQSICDESLINEIKQYGLYNSQLLTCAPTGSIATMLQVSTGVEPNFAFTYTRKTQTLNGEDTYYDVSIKIINDYYDKVHDYEDGDDILPKLPNYFVESKDISPIDRIRVQSVLQSFTDASISSTINLPNSATIEDVYNIYVEAWKYGLKGVTVYRSGCMREGILTTGETSNEESKSSNDKETKSLDRGEIIKAGNDWIGLKSTLMTGCGTLHCCAYFEPTNGELRECYLSKGSLGGCQNFMIGLSRLISLSARGGIKIDDILDQLKSCGVCPSYAVRTATKKDTSPGSCCPVAVGKALKEMHNKVLNIINNRDTNNAETIKVKVKEVIDLEECPNCHEKTLIHTGGCVQCNNCSYSKCD